MVSSCSGRDGKLLTLRWYITEQTLAAVALRWRRRVRLTMLLDDVDAVESTVRLALRAFA